MVVLVLVQEEEPVGGALLHLAQVEDSVEQPAEQACIQMEQRVTRICVRLTQCKQTTTPR